MRYNYKGTSMLDKYRLHMYPLCAFYNLCSFYAFMPS